MCDTAFPPDTAAFFRALYGDARFSRILSALRRPSGSTTLRVNHAEGADSGDPSASGSVRVHADDIAAVNSAMAHFSARLSAQGRDPVVATNHPVIGDAVLIPSAVSSPATEMPGFPHDDSVEAVVVVDRLCAEAVLRGADIFSAGILACNKVCKGNHVRVFAVCKNRVPRGSKPSQFISAAQSDGETALYLGRGIYAKTREEIMGKGYDPKARSGVAVRIFCRAQNVGDAPPLNQMVDKLGGEYFAQPCPAWSHRTPYHLVPARQSVTCVPHREGKAHT